MGFTCPYPFITLLHDAQRFTVDVHDTILNLFQKKFSFVNQCLSEIQRDTAKTTEMNEGFDCIDKRLTVLITDLTDWKNGLINWKNSSEKFCSYVRLTAI